jgi:serine/threonine protein kinase
MLSEVILYLSVAEDNISLKNNIVKVELTYPEYFDSKVKNLLDRCFQYDPCKRITVNQLLQHPWLLKFKEQV